MNLNTGELVAIVDASANPMLDAALWYIRHGWPVLPATDDGKLPSKTQMPGVSYQAAAITEDKVRSWWGEGGRFQGWNISVPTGGSSRIAVVDIDNKNGKNGSKAWADRASIQEEIPEDTLMAHTPSGGVHIFFQSVTGFICGTDNIAIGVDTRGHRKGSPETDAGHILVYPSTKSNGQYKWVPDTALVAKPLQWIVDLISKIRPLPIEIEIPDVIHEGGRDDFLYKVGLQMAARGMSEQDVTHHMEEVGARFDPPDDYMVKEKIRSVLESSIFKDQEVLGEMELDKSDKGGVLKTATNLTKIIRSSLFKAKFNYKYDEFKRKVTINGENLVDGDDIDMVCFIEQKFGVGFYNSTGSLSVYDVLMRSAKTCERHDSYADYFNSVPRPLQSSSLLFDELAGLMGIPDSTDLRYQYLRCSMIAMIGRALQPGCKVDTIPVLCGGQGSGKSSFVQALVPQRNWFSDELSPDVTRGGSAGKDAIMKLDGKAAVEAQEMTAFKVRSGEGQSAAIKQFVTTTVDEYRLPYSRLTQDFPRRFILWGTTNTDDFLTDTTGNRRYFPMSLPGSIHKAIDFLRLRRDEIWGELVYAHLVDKETWTLSLEDQERQDETNNQHMKQDPLHDQVMAVIPYISRFNASDIMTHVLKFTPDKMNLNHQKRINNIITTSGMFRTAGTIAVSKENGGGKFKGFKNKDAATDEKFKGTRWTHTLDRPEDRF